MSSLDFPTWYGVGSYGGLAVTLLAALGIVFLALRQRRGTHLQLARSILVCLSCGSLMLAAIWWNQNRLDFYGPSLDAGEVTFWLAWTALLGWGIPLGMLASYAILAVPQSEAAQPAPVLGRITDPPGAAYLNDPGRAREPLGASRAWGRLVPLDGVYAGQAVALTRQVTLFGRELDNDVVVDDDRASRHHAELRWDRGRVQLLDFGSMNGSMVNGQIARGPTPLRSGDVVQIGQRSYRIEMMVSGALARTGGLLDEETAKTPGVSLPKLPEAPMLILVAVSGPVAGTRWALDKSLVTLGRDEDRDIAISHPSISRAHAQVVRQKAGYFLTDLHSRNGTRLNGEPLVAPALLAPGDVVRVGEIELRCEAVDMSLSVHTTPLAGRDNADSHAPDPSAATIGFTQDDFAGSVSRSSDAPSLPANETQP